MQDAKILLMRLESYHFVEAMTVLSVRHIFQVRYKVPKLSVRHIAIPECTKRILECEFLFPTRPSLNDQNPACME